MLKTNVNGNFEFSENENVLTIKSIGNPYIAPGVVILFLALPYWFIFDQLGSRIDYSLGLIILVATTIAFGLLVILYGRKLNITCTPDQIHLDFLFRKVTIRKEDIFQILIEKSWMLSDSDIIPSGYRIVFDLKSKRRISSAAVFGLDELEFIRQRIKNKIG